MIYHEITSSNVQAIYLNLEELVFLGNLLGIGIKIKTNTIAEEYFDLSAFEIADKCDEHYIPINLSNYVCMMDKDFDDIEGSEFLFYRKKQKVNAHNLEKFKHNDFNIRFSQTNLYENKYYHSNSEVYKRAIKAASNFNLPERILKKYDFLNQILPSKPLLCLSKNYIDTKPTNLKLPFDECFYVIDEESQHLQDFFNKNKLLGTNLEQFVKNYHLSFKDVNPVVPLLSCVDLFTEIYGTTYNDLYAILCKQKYIRDKNWKPKIINNLSYGNINNFEIKEPIEFGMFMISRMNLNCDRNILLSLIRCNDCVV